MKQTLSTSQLVSLLCQDEYAGWKLEEAIAYGADVLALACPYCMCMFKDSQLTVDGGDTIEVKDLWELVQEVL